MRTTLAMILLFLATSSRAAQIVAPLQNEQSDYVVSQTFRLTKAANGLDGVLELRIDSRLTDLMQREMWGVGEWSFVISENDPHYAEFTAKPPRNAELRITDGANRVLHTALLDRPLAKLQTEAVLERRTSFLVSVDYSVGFGSYAGVTTQILDVVDGQFRWAVATSVGANAKEQIRLPSTLKTEWKFVAYKGNKDILLFECRPAKVQVSGREFVLVYIRYRFDGTRWLMYRRLRNGFWESDEPFPPLSSFP